METGDRLPDILGINQNGNEVETSSFTGKKLILYFYPKDMTSGCSAEADSLRDNYEQLKTEGYEVLGVSPDSEASHRKFIEKNNLPFNLIADTDHKLAEEMGVWGEKSMYGRKYFGIFRTTFITDENGVITKIFRPKDIKTRIHGNQILELSEK